MVERFTTTLDCVDTTFIGDGFLDQLPAPNQIGTTRVGGVDLNKPRLRGALSAVLALATAPGGFTVAQFTAKVHAMTGTSPTPFARAPTTCASCAEKDLLIKPGRTRRYHCPDPAASSIAALLALRDEIIAPILAGVRSPRRGRKPATWTRVDRDYETLRIDMRPSSATSASPPQPPHRQHLVDRSLVSA